MLKLIWTTQIIFHQNQLQSRWQKCGIYVGISLNVRFSLFVEHIEKESSADEYQIEFGFEIDSISSSDDKHPTRVYKRTKTEILDNVIGEENMNLYNTDTNLIEKCKRKLFSPLRENIQETNTEWKGMEK